MDTSGCADVSIALAKRLAGLNVADARASDPDDEEMITRLVQQEGGAEKMNEFIRENMWGTLTKEQEHFEAEVDKLGAELNVAAREREGSGKVMDTSRQPSLWAAARRRLLPDECTDAQYVPVASTEAQPEGLSHGEHADLGARHG